MEKQRRVIALGFFDGVHLGHGALLRTVVRRAGELDMIPSAFTFDLHPENVILGTTPPLLSTPVERTLLMRRLYGIQDVIVAHFDLRMMQMPWEDFITQFLLGECGAGHLVAGHDFHFGYRGEGNPERLRAKCRELGIGCDIIEPVSREGIVVSSTYIRTLVAQGEMERARAFLGHPHTFTNVVGRGKKLGGRLGFPTVNQRIPFGVIVPARGVYATLVRTEGQCFQAVTNVGVRPTVDDGEQVNVESYILDFDGDLYDRPLQVEFWKFLRPEQKFPDLEALRRAVMENAGQTRAYFSRLSPEERPTIPV